MEGRVLDAIPARLLSVDNTASLQDEINKERAAAAKAGERDHEKLKGNRTEVSRRQEVVAAQIMERILHGQPQIDAFTKLLDDLQKQRDEIEGSLATGRTKRRDPPETFTINPAMYAAAVGALTAVARTGANDHHDVQRHFNLLRTLVQKIVIAPSADGKSAELTIHGRVVGVLASMLAFQNYGAGLREQHAGESARRVRAGEFKDKAEKLAYLSRFCASLAEEEASSRRLQVSLVAGAGFEPAAFRL